MRQSLEYLLGFFTPEGYEKHSIEAGKIHLLLYLCLLGLGISTLHLLFFTLIGFYLGIWLTLSVPLAILFILYLIWQKRYLNLSIGITLFGVQVSVFGIALLSGDSDSPMLVWLFIPPILSTLLQGYKKSIVWLLISILNFVLIYTLDSLGYAFPVFPGIWFEEFHLLSLSSILLFLIVLVWGFQKHQQLVQNKLTETYAALEERSKAVEHAHRNLARQHQELAHKNNEISTMTTRLEDIVEERTDSLRKVNEELDIFLYRSSHDLRRPLTSLLGIFEVMRLEQGDNPNLTNMLGKAEDVVADMDNMLRKLIMISNVYSENSPYSQVNFGQLFTDLQYSFKDTLSSTNVLLQVHYPQHHPVCTNKDLLEIILYNLIENSLKFQPSVVEKPDNRNVKIDIVIQEENFRLEISDEGIGIAPEQQDKIFKLFYKAHHHHNIGHGLGLYIVKKAIEKLDGEINIESEVGKGSTFHITLPNQYQE